MSYYAADYKYEKFVKTGKPKEIVPTHSISNDYGLKAIIGETDKETLIRELSTDNDISVINSLKFIRFVDISHDNKYSPNFAIYDKYNTILNFIYTSREKTYFEEMLNKYGIKISHPPIFIIEVMLIYMLKDGIVTTTDIELYDELVVYKTMFLSGELVERMINDNVFVKI